jgi:hypothetical protein
MPAPKPERVSFLSVKVYFFILFFAVVDDECKVETVFSL